MLTSKFRCDLGLEINLIILSQVMSTEVQPLVVFFFKEKLHINLFCCENDIHLWCHLYKVNNDNLSKKTRKIITCTLPRNTVPTRSVKLDVIIDRQAREILHPGIHYFLAKMPPPRGWETVISILVEIQFVQHFALTAGNNIDLVLKV